MKIYNARMLVLILKWIQILLQTDDNQQWLLSFLFILFLIFLFLFFTYFPFIFYPNWNEPYLKNNNNNNNNKKKTIL